MPVVGLQADVRAVRAEDAASGGKAVRFDLVFSTGATVRRYDWINGRFYKESLEISTEAIDMSRLQRGAPLLDTHWASTVTDQLGVCELPRIEGGQGICTATLSNRDQAKGVRQDVQDGILRNFSVGYTRNKIIMESPEVEGGDWLYRVTSWTPMEVSIVPIPADMDAQIRSEGGKLQDGQGRELRSYPCEFTELPATRAAIPNTPLAEGVKTSAAPHLQTNQETRMDKDQEGGTNAAATAQATASAKSAETQRCTSILEICARHKMTDQASAFIAENKSVDEVRALVLDKLAALDAGGERNVSYRVSTVKDEHATRMAGMEEAIMRKIDAGAAITDNGRRFAGMSMVEMGRSYLQSVGVDTMGMAPVDVAGNMLRHQVAGMQTRAGIHTSTDMPSLLGNIANRRLRAAYDLYQPTYRLWARRAPSAPDFKNINVIQLSGAPDLMKVNEAGEFKYGTLTESGESYKVVTNGRIVSVTRQAIVNDNLRGFDRVIGSFGESASRLENRLAYSILTANANMADGVPIFAAGHSNLLTGAPSALSLTSLSDARKTLRKQKGLKPAPDTVAPNLNLSPKWFIVPSELETLAYQLTSSQYMPTAQSGINEFAAGGRTSLTAIVEPLLDEASATAFYVMADSAQIDTVEYCYLDGYEGPRIDTQMGFDVDGIQVRCAHDFAVKDIDFRGMVKSNGA